jgi:hypothetical protein
MRFSSVHEWRALSVKEPVEEAGGAVSASTTQGACDY